ncbi:HpcH/HpaI aldolase/citrate lyase family protein [Sphaerosporella brunnea]|uniref:HpcH/HpaI aldolase/citrate lyase family protein n=1 Tax=Sphaerosporella brunnea TaxID=1250544 RepID=A0A5J5EH58_9PEZI|nr:HpcH/HpaI aldolase/citrate lyase family protein [Sphaerosporella brunnea]
MQQHRALSLFQPSNLAKAIEGTLDPSSGVPISHLFGSVVALPHTTIARSVAVLGLDFVMIDALHSAINAENLIQLVQTVNLASEGRTVAVVRVPSSESELLTHALDAGAAGIIFPHIDTPEEAARAVEKCKYPYSGGDRSLSPSALIAGATDLAPPGYDHLRVADAHIAVIVQIESTLALDNLEAIASTPGVNALMLGPGDLRVSLGLPHKPVGSAENDHPRFLREMDRLIAVSQRHRKPLMTVAFKVSANSNAWVSKFSLLLTSADIISVVNGHRQDLANMKTLLKECEKRGEAALENGNGQPAAKRSRTDSAERYIGQANSH